MPVSLSLEIRDGQVRTALRAATLAVQTIPAQAARKAMEDASKRARANYPSGGVMGYNVGLRPGQTYVRTGTYGSGFKVLPGANNQYVKTYRLVNPVKYAQWVGGDEFGNYQVWFHRNRWPVISVQVDKAVEDAIAWASAEFNRQLGLGPGGL